LPLLLGIECEGSRQGEPGLEPQVLAKRLAAWVEGFDLWGYQGSVRPQVELHVVVGDRAPHGGEELCVDQGHPAAVSRVRGTSPAASSTQRESW